MTLACALVKWADVRAGREVVFSDETLDILQIEFNSREEKDVDADIFFYDFVTVPNPKRVGIRDQYVGRSTRVEAK